MFDLLGPTRFDLKWRMFGIGVRVHPLFWLIALLMGPTDLGPQFLWESGTWVAVVFVSLLVHELGHALVARAYRWYPSILLYAFGGLTFHDPHPYAVGKRILLLLGGPFAQFALAGVVLLAVEAGGEPEAVAAKWLIRSLLWVNLGWGVLNLFPVHPLDGGQITRILFGWLWPAKGERWAAHVSIVIAIAIAGLAIYPLRQMYIAVLFGILALQEIMLLRGPPPGYGGVGYYRQP
jgi:Zn-dependent protease